MKILVNAVAFKVGWLSSVIGAVNEMPLLGPAVILVALAIHLQAVHAPSRELMLILATGAAGLLWDSLMITAGWLSYPTGILVAGVSPYWIVAMWMLFATTFNLSIRWLRSRILLAALFGALSGPASYYAGEKLGAVTFQDFPAAMLGLAVTWGALLPLLLLLARRLDGVTVPQPAVVRSGSLA
jgi:hypothetical protein